MTEASVWVGFAGVILGAALTVLGSVFTTILRLKGRADYFDRAAQDFLTSKFKNKRSLSWNELKKIGEAVGLRPFETRQLLLLAGFEPTSPAGKSYKPAPTSDW
jgi:hypothetical protein